MDIMGFCIIERVGPADMENGRFDFRIAGQALPHNSYPVLAVALDGGRAVLHAYDEHTRAAINRAEEAAQYECGTFDERWRARRG